MKKRENNKIYNAKKLVIGTFLGGPLAGFYLLSKNLKAIGYKDGAKQLWILGIFVNIIFWGIRMLPSFESVINSTGTFTVPILYTLCFYLYYIRYQKDLIHHKLNNGGKIASIWNVLLISIIMLAITIILGVSIGFLYDIILL